MMFHPQVTERSSTYEFGRMVLIILMRQMMLDMRPPAWGIKRNPRTLFSVKQLHN